MAAEVLYKTSALKDLKKLDRSAARRIVERIDTDLAVHPGKDKPLTGQYKGLFSFRVGDYRVVFAMLADAILVLRIICSVACPALKQSPAGPEGL